MDRINRRMEKEERLHELEDRTKENSQCEQQRECIFKKKKKNQLQYPEPVDYDKISNVHDVRILEGEKVRF